MTGFILKLIAAVTMCIDHAGLLLFPDALWMRAVGRLAFPLYAWCIAEGFRYTHSRKRYFFQIFLLGAACQLVAFFADGTKTLGILLTFSLSILLMWIADRARHAEADDSPAAWRIAFVCAVVAALLLCQLVSFDYGFFGVMLPVFPSLFESRRNRFSAFALGLAALCVHYAVAGVVLQCLSLCALIPLFFYNGKPGRYRMKYFFYIFYPLHLAVLQGIAWLL